MKIKLVSLNFWLLPLFSIHNNERIRNFGSWIRKQNPDIIALQEVWMHKYAKRISKAIGNKYHVHYSNSIFNKTGFVFATKLTPNKVYVRHFPRKINLNLIEYFANKGYQIAEFKNFTLINTHFYAPISKGEHKILSEDYKLIKNIVDENKIPTVIVGDLNISTKNLLKLDKSIIPSSINHSHTVEKNNPYTNLYFNKLGHTYDAIDHVITLKSDNTIKIKQQVIKNPIFSDHYAILADIIIAN